MKKKDLEQSHDKIGDIALFIEERHFIKKNELDNTTKKYIQITFKNSEDIFFRVIKNGVQKNEHGYIRAKTAEVVKRME